MMSRLTWLGFPIRRTSAVKRWRRLDQLDARQALHVTFGTLLNARDEAGRLLFRDRLYALLEGHEEAHYAALETHIARRLRPLSN